MSCCEVCRWRPLLLDRFQVGSNTTVAGRTNLNFAAANPPTMLLPPQSLE
jgi:hypothetical protein